MDYYETKRCIKQLKSSEMIFREITGCNFDEFDTPLFLISVVRSEYGTHHSYVLVVHTLRVAENEILKLDFPAKRH
jgi:hypothetical protein